MTAETLKPFLNLPNATANDLKAQCAKKPGAKRVLLTLGCILAAALCCALIGVQIWHLNKTAALQREVDDLKLQLYLRVSEFNDYELDNELFESPDDYGTGYEPDLDSELTEHGVQETSELLESGLNSSGMPGEDDEADNDDDDDDTDENLGIEDLREMTGLGEDIPVDDTTVDMGVPVAVSGGKRRARAISGVTRQGVPIVDEPYVPRRNRTRQPHRIFEQLRQRPEELVTPPTSDEMFRWDVEGRKSHASSQHQSYGSISIRPYHHGAHGVHEQPTTSPAPVVGSGHSNVRPHARYDLNPAKPTQPPAQILNRRSRVQSTGENVRERVQQTQRFPKVVGNPGTRKEVVMTPESRVRLRHRKANLVRAGQHSGEPLAKGVHLVKQYESGMNHRNTRHRDWIAKDDFSKKAIVSTTFSFDGEELAIKEPGLYYIYAQITYDNSHDMNGYKVLVGGKKHLSCTVHSHGNNTNACYTAGLVEVTTPDALVAIEDVDHGRHHVMYPEKTFFGAYKIGRLPPASKGQN